MEDIKKQIFLILENSDYVITGHIEDCVNAIFKEQKDVIFKRKCKTCNLEKEISLYTRIKDKKNGDNSYMRECNKCLKEKRSAYHQKYNEKRRKEYVSKKKQ